MENFKKFASIRIIAGILIIIGVLWLSNFLLGFIAPSHTSYIVSKKHQTTQKDSHETSPKHTTHEPAKDTKHDVQTHEPDHTKPKQHSAPVHETTKHKPQKQDKQHEKDLGQAAGRPVAVGEGHRRHPLAKSERRC